MDHYETSLEETNFCLIVLPKTPQCEDLWHPLTVEFCLCCKNANLCKSTNFYCTGHLLLCGMVYFYRASFPSGWLVFSGYMHFVAHSQFAFFPCNGCKSGIPGCLLCNMRALREIFVRGMTSQFICNKNVVICSDHHLPVRLTSFGFDFQVLIFNYLTSIRLFVDICWIWWAAFECKMFDCFFCTWSVCSVYLFWHFFFSFDILLSCSFLLLQSSVDLNRKEFPYPARSIETS